MCGGSRAGGAGLTARGGLAAPLLLDDARLEGRVERRAEERVARALGVACGRGAAR